MELQKLHTEMVDLTILLLSLSAALRIVGEEWMSVWFLILKSRNIQTNFAAPTTLATNN
jgi:hypothetical protein